MRRLDRTSAFMNILVERIKMEFYQVVFGVVALLAIFIIVGLTNLDSFFDFLFLLPAQLMLPYILVQSFIFSETGLNKIEKYCREHIGMKTLLFFVGPVVFFMKYFHAYSLMSNYPDWALPLLISMGVSILLTIYVDASHQVNEDNLNEDLKEVKTEVLKELERDHNYSIKDILAKYKILSYEQPQSTKKYTNTEFRKHSLKFLEVYHSMVSFMEYCKNIRVKETYFNDDRPYKDSFVKIAMNHKKGFDGEELVRNTLIDNGVKFIESVNLKNGNEQIEVDFMIVKGNNVITLEVKDYNAEEIVLDKSGELYKVIKGKREKVEDVLSQVNRHRRFMKMNFPEGINIINLIVLSDKKTTVVNLMDNMTPIQIVIPALVVNIVEGLESDNMIMEQKVYDLVKQYACPERQFDFFDIEHEIREMQELLVEGAKISQEHVGYYSLYMEWLYADLMERHTHKHLELYGKNTVIQNGKIRELYSNYISDFEYIQSQILEHDSQDNAQPLENAELEDVS